MRGSNPPQIIMSFDSLEHVMLGPSDTMATEFCQILNLGDILNPLATCGPSTLLSLSPSVMFDSTTGKLFPGSWEDNRSTSIVLADNEDILRTIPAGVLPYAGARVVQNLVAATDFGDAAYALTDCTRTSGIDDPFGGTDAYTITAVGGLGYIRDSSVAGTYDVNGDYLGSYYLRRRTGTGRVRVLNPNALLTTVTTYLTDQWQRLSYVSGPQTATNIRVGVYLDVDGDQVDIYFPQCENVTGQANQAPGERVAVTGSGDYDGLAIYNTANGNSVDGSGIVTEATGAALSPAPWLEHWPASSNYTDTDDDLSGGAETVDLTAGGTGDYTLSVAGTAAVTVAAGTATGTGFGQATEGSTVTFNLTGAGTVTLTLDSGTLDSHEGAYVKQVEKQSFATPFIPSSGAGASTRNAVAIRYPYSTSVFNQNEGMLYGVLQSNQAQTDYTTTDEGGVSVADAAANLFYIDSGGFRSTDGTNSAVVDPSFAADTDIPFAVTWSSDNGIRIGYKSGGTWTWDSSTAAYDGGFTAGSYINLFYSNAHGMQLSDLEIYISDEGTSWIEANK